MGDSLSNVNKNLPVNQQTASQENLHPVPLEQKGKKNIGEATHDILHPDQKPSAPATVPVKLPENINVSILKNGSKLWKLGMKILLVAMRIFPSKIAEAARAKYYANIMEKRANVQEKFTASNEQLDLHVEFGKELASGKPGRAIPDELFLPIDVLKKTSVDHETTARQAASSDNPPEVAPLPAPGLDGYVVATSFKTNDDGSISLVENSINPTSDSLGKEEGLQHLANAYVLMVDGKEYGVIRSGVIDKKEFANDFVALMKDVIMKLPEDVRRKPIRIVSQQLNSPDNENPLVEAQHSWMVYANRELNRQLKDNGVVVQLVHINLPSNRWVDHIRSLERLGPVGSAIISMAPGTLLKGEQLSYEQNLDSWGTYVDWATETLQTACQSNAAKAIPRLVYTQHSAVSEITHIGVAKPARNALSDYLDQLNQGNILTLKKAKLIGQLVETKQSLKDQLAHTVLTPTEKMEVIAALKKNNQELRSQRQAMRKLLEEQYQILADLDTDVISKELPRLSKKDPKSEDELRLMHALEGMTLMRQVLGAQLGLDQVSRGKEGMLIHLLNDRLGVTSAMNCKSGLDRTGFSHAVKLAMMRFEKETGPGSAFALVNKWEERTELMNKMEEILSKEGTTLEDWFQDLSSKKDFHLNDLMIFEDLYPDDCISITTIDGRRELVLNQGKIASLFIEMDRIIKFRYMVLESLLAVGLPITQKSTGLVGLKWNKGLIANLIPWNFIPPAVTTKSGASRRLVDYNSDGSVKGMTDDGEALLMKLASSRGS